ncbi:hypothetical protein A8E95_29450 [Burkholderia cenocepacia]|nr:hypothetical protein A8E96_19005 [Burkholderia cenocepacia]ONW26995.1 hypothetical protein A8E95_29450 [Burkholderia cenocepacia]
MSHPAAHGVVPRAWSAVSGSDRRAGIRPHANVRRRASAPSDADIDAAPAAVRRSRFFHPIRHSLIQP